MIRRRPLLGGMAAALAAGPVAGQPSYDAARRRMVGNIQQLAAAGALGGPRRLSPAVLDALRTVPRHRFVPRDLEGEAYGDTPLPIGHGATISQPFMVAIMTDLLQARSDWKVLEVGTGSGYQAAVLAALGAQVFTIEIVPELARTAEARLAALGYRGVQVRAGDGYKGWPEAAPFDGILVTAGATHVPTPLVEQLKPGGRMVIPVGPSQQLQQLTVVTKDARGAVRTTRLGPVLFVPLQEDARRR
ncbi:protein-L-isoaspartate(D-aspartate) O-methyltransferase [Phenylobacterium sp.]|uniref:protein-L-isoaspartate(D-aspartate) O-methyltransferase n=1 Tax=Phenylobacterium sp. TaxID=1871053 RepID=UPI002810CE41|nr:protein-L-isoaspartate(D-aspartate) O-methyltransferase [Phenylobacterium sp.]